MTGTRSRYLACAAVRQRCVARQRREFRPCAPRADRSTVRVGPEGHVPRAPGWAARPGPGAGGGGPSGSLVCMGQGQVELLAQGGEVQVREPELVGVVLQV